jgi:hypothetical protein
MAPATTTTPTMTVRDADTKVNFLAWYKYVFGFTDPVAKALYDKQLLQDKKTLAKLSNSEIDSIMRAICRTQAIAEMSAARLKLAIFWIKHQDRTQREIGIPAALLVRVTLDTIMLLKTQKHLEDEWRLGNQEPNYPPVTLDLASATKTLNKTRTILSRVCGVTGVPLSYVIRNILNPPLTVDDHTFGEPDSAYTSIDLELILRAPILSVDADSSDNDDELKANGPFHLTFLTDAKKVWVILHAQYSTSAAWQHVKKYLTMQNDRQVWHTLHTFFFGGDRVSTMHSDIILTLKTLFYSGDRKNYNFDKYWSAHVEQHNRLTALLEFRVQDIDKAMKIHYFEEGIKDDSFNSVKTTIMVDRSRFPDFNSVMNLYSNFKRSQKNDIVPQGRTISALTQGRGGDGQCLGGTGRGRGCGGNSCASMLIPQEEVNMVTDVEAKFYPTDVYNSFTPAQKAKHWQLMNPGKTPGSGPAKGARGGTGATASGMNHQIAEFKTAMSSAATAISDLTTATKKRTAIDEELDITRDSGWGRNRSNNRENPALARQDPAKKLKN